MICFMCKGTVQEGFSTFTADMSDCIIVIKNVPSRVCDQCGKASYSDEVARRLEQIVHSVTGSAGVEIAVVCYNEVTKLNKTDPLPPEFDEIASQNKEWEIFMHGLNSFSDDYMSEGRLQGEDQT